MYRTNIIILSSLLLILTSIVAVPVVPGIFSISLFLAALMLVQLGLINGRIKFLYVASVAIICIVIALLAWWAELEALKTFNDNSLQEELRKSIGNEAASDFFIGQASAAKYMATINSTALFEAFILAIYSAFLSTKKSGSDSN
ncbi:MAG: hypothetical protein Q7J58_16160 [Hydrogenophaga sp.]|uniref:hypothetical protein n=1 Tax=Hydrogenophaga sp. TaxID=1904254 RepID=UPI002715CCEC|nr:hypothetical protein [Hydrogenophaga sp.]MDO9570891.1 hypothetical protein [Hydrogenophaga sp.]